MTQQSKLRDLQALILEWYLPELRDLSPLTPSDIRARIGEMTKEVACDDARDYRAG